MVRQATRSGPTLPLDLPVAEPDADKVQALHDCIDNLGPVAVAFSGGVDSALALKVCRDRLGSDAHAVIGVSASLAAAEHINARRLAARLDVDLIELNTDELENAAYRKNPANRCYFCKQELFRHVLPLASKHGWTVVDGLNHDDLRDIRPGRLATDEAGVRHPLCEAGLTKPEVRGLARRLGLSVWNKPALACLSSRIPTGLPIDAELLTRVDQAEAMVKQAGFPSCRVRVHGTLARIEVPAEHIADLERRCPSLIPALQAIGFRQVEIDPRGYRMGSVSHSSGR